MILANVREQFTLTDVELVIELLSRGDVAHKGELARVAEERGLDALLDAPDLPELLRAAPRLGQPSPALFVYVVVRHALCGVGIESARLSDYLGALVLEFGLRDRAYRISRVGPSRIPVARAPRQPEPVARRALPRSHHGSQGASRRAGPAVL
jgi:hypothetical protein